MAPHGLLQRLREYWPYGKAIEPVPPLSTKFAVLTSISFTLGYVLPFYLSRLTRPSSTLSRDSPSVIKARIRSVYLSCTACTAVSIYILSVHVRLPYWETLKLLGWYPISLTAIARALFLTATLFLGPLFERVVVEEGWRDFLAFEPLIAELRSSIGWRNYVAGPVSEEILFRSLLVPINLLSPQVLTPGLKGNHAKSVILTTPLYFGLAHIHHLYEFRLTHPHIPWKFAVAQAILQLTYTTLFGWYATFVYVRTGSLWAVILAHSFCNWMGLPRVWGSVERPQAAAPVPTAMGPSEEEIPSNRSSRKSRSGSFVRSRSSAAMAPYQQYKEHCIGSSRSSVAWNVAYYTLLVAGAFGFYKSLWPLTESTHQLSDIL